MCITFWGTGKNMSENIPPTSSRYPYFHWWQFSTAFTNSWRRIIACTGFSYTPRWLNTYFPQPAGKKPLSPAVTGLAAIFGHLWRRFAALSGRYPRNAVLLTLLKRCFRDYRPGSRYFRETWWCRPGVVRQVNKGKIRVLHSVLQVLCLSSWIPRLATHTVSHF